MKSVNVFFILSVLFSGTASVQAQYKLTLNCTGFSPHVGQAIHIRVLDTAGNVEVGRKTIPVLQNESFTAELWVLLEGHSYVVDLFADLNGNGRYDAPPADHAWLLQAENITGDTQVDLVHNFNFTDIQWEDPPDFTEYLGVWTGYWHNLTFNTMDDMTSEIQMNEAMDTVSVYTETAGVFGNPADVAYDTKFPFDPEADSVSVQVTDPWPGEAHIAYGEFETDSQVDLYSIQLHFAGNFGPTQFMAAYEMTGAFSANGIIVMQKPSSTGVTEHKAGLPVSSRLLENYPNPFNPSTAIRYQLTGAGRIQLNIYNAEGQRVRTLLDEYQQPGIHTVRWNAAGQPSGSYIYRLKTGSELLTGKMILRK